LVLIVDQLDFEPADVEVIFGVHLVWLQNVSYLKRSHYHCQLLYFWVLYAHPLWQSSA
jgi:hypothetical protein